MPHVILDASLTPTSAGGRAHPFTEGYCPHLTAEGSNTYLGVRLIDCPARVHPGERAILKFELMYAPQVDYSALKTGSTATLWEGSSPIGKATVLSIEH